MYALPTQRRRHRAAPETTPLWRLFLINLSFSLSRLTEPLQRLCWCCGGGKWAREQAFHLVSTLLCAGMLWQRSIIQSIEHMCSRCTAATTFLSAECHAQGEWMGRYRVCTAVY